jgi:hypothetical protein
MSQASKRILDEIAPEWSNQFMLKAQDYGDGHEYLGIRGQFSDMNRKFQKLKRFMWDNPDEEPVGESLEEILFDMIGHCFLTIDLLRQAEKRSAFEGSQERVLRWIEAFLEDLGSNDNLTPSEKTILGEVKGALS